jgi:hypothetical protein
MNYAFPGFQTPDSPKADAQVFSEADGSVDFCFLKNRPLDERMPAFVLYIGINHGADQKHLATAPTTKFLYAKREDNNTQSYWCRFRNDELVFQPGSYNFQFILDGKEVAARVVTVRPNPASPRIYAEPAPLSAN